MSTHLVSPQANKRRRISINSICTSSALDSSSSFVSISSPHDYDNSTPTKRTTTTPTTCPVKVTPPPRTPTTTSDTAWREVFEGNCSSSHSSSSSAVIPLMPYDDDENEQQQQQQQQQEAHPQQQEKRQDIDDCTVRCRDENDTTTTRTSPRSSPIAVLKLRRTNLFPEEEGKPTKPITITYRPSERRGGAEQPIQLSSHSIASSMFLVSPLRPLARVNAAPSKSCGRSQGNVDLRTSLIDSSQTILRPLTPLSKTTKPKRSLSDAMLHMDEEEDDDQVFGGGQEENNLVSSRRDAGDSLLLPRTPTKITFESKQTQSVEDEKDQSLSSKQQQQQQQRWLIPAEHPYKVLWDVLTFVLSLANVYATHTSIRDRQFGNSWFTTFCEAWFIVDILLNFITEYQSDTYALRDCRSVWARYLTTWFVVDVLSLFPGEVLYLQPIIDKQNRRNFFTKYFFRSKGVLRVTRMLRGRHFKWFGKAANQTKHVGVGASRLARLMIKYLPKYWLFFRNMKGVAALRMLRQVHWFRKVWRNMRGLDCGVDMMGGGSGVEPATRDPPLSLRKFRPEYDYNEDEDGSVPF